MTRPYGDNTAAVLRYLRAWPGKKIFSKELQRECGLGSDQVSNAIATLSQHYNQVKRISVGVYIWDDRDELPLARKDAGDASGLSEGVGTTKDGRLLLRHETGRFIVGDWL